VKYTCEQVISCGPGPNPACTAWYSGIVRPALVDCAGNCQGGVCEDRCPGQGQNIVYESTDGAGYFVARNQTDGERYQCTIVFDNDRDAFNCIQDPKVGDVARIDASSNGTCEAEFPLAVVVNGSDAAPGAAQCSLSCRRVSGDLAPTTGAAPPLTPCPAAGQVASGPLVGSPGVRSLLSGTNGQFQDRCTTDGNLVDYACDITNASTGPPWHVYSGMVTTSYYDCGGTCQDGACIASCPTAGQTLSFQSAVTSGYVLVRNEAEGRGYGCAITWDDPSDTFDCATGVHSGTTGSIVTLAGNGSACTASFAEIPVSIDGAASSCSGCPQCKMNCRVTP
jgi:hypothetical protein